MDPQSEQSQHAGNKTWRDRITSLSKAKQMAIGMGITFAFFALAAGLTAAMQPSSTKDEYAFLGYFFMLSVAAGVAGVTALIAFALKLRWVALGIIILDAVPLLIVASCFGLMIAH